jgi:hypothetical protein
MSELPLSVKRLAYGLDHRGMGVRIQAAAEIFLSFHGVKTGPGAQPFSQPNDT